MDLSRSRFFSRMSLIEDIGEEGIEKLSKKTVAIVGLGGLGSHLALYMGLSGVGRLKLIDIDIVEYTNLHRQILYTVEDLGMFKVEVARDKLAIQTPYTKIDIFPMMLTPWNVERVFRNVDLILDGSDNLPTRFLINRYSVKYGVPYLYTAVESRYATLSLIKPPETPCLECIIKSREDVYRVNPIMETTVALASSLEASEAIKYLLYKESSLVNRLLTIDLKRLNMEYIEVSKDPGCRVCSSPEVDIEDIEDEYDFYLFHRGDTIIFNPREKIRLDIEPLTRELSGRYIIYRRGRVGVAFYLDKYLAGVTYSGNIIVKNVEDRDSGVKIVEKLVDLFREYVID